MSVLWVKVLFYLLCMEVKHRMTKQTLCCFCQLANLFYTHNRFKSKQDASAVVLTFQHH